MIVLGLSKLFGYFFVGNDEYVPSASSIPAVTTQNPKGQKMSIQIFPNLPVKDLEAAKKFYTSLGFPLNEDFSDENAASIVIADNIVVMLLRHEFFSTFDSRKIADGDTTVETVHALGVESREKVDQLVDAAVASGGKEAGAAKDEGFMYGRSFFDLDGHHWEVMFMDLSAMPAE